MIIIILLSHDDRFIIPFIKSQLQWLKLQGINTICLESYDFDIGEEIPDSQQEHRKKGIRLSEHFQKLY